MSFTKNNQSNNQTTENTSENNQSLFGKVMPFVPLILEEFTGQKMKMSGTIGDILTCLQRLEQKFNDFAKNCAEQFIHQEQQLNALQQVSKLVNTEKTKEIHFTNA